MLKFFYDSLDTVKGLKQPTTSYFISITIAIFLMVAVGALYFIGVDTVVSQLYMIFYNLIKA